VCKCQIVYSHHANPIFGTPNERSVSEYDIKKSLHKLNKIPDKKKFYLKDNTEKFVIVARQVKKNCVCVITVITNLNKSINFSDGSPVLEVS